MNGVSSFMSLSAVVTFLCNCNFVRSSDKLSDDSPTAVADQINEFCQLETMRGRCRWKSEVIVMMSARWGRMRTGRCLDVHPNALAALGHDPMFIGCSEDVMSIADRKCSGRSQCDIRIPDSDLDKVTPCYPDLTRYLEASYTCVKVVQESRSCVAAVSAEQQYLSSSSLSTDVNSLSTCGSRSHPWRLEAPVGQRITISLLDFSGPVITPRDHDVTTSCRQYGYIVEKSNKKNVSICAVTAAGGSKWSRESSVHTSDSNRVDIVLLTATNTKNYSYLVKVHAVGCTNMIPPDNAWLKRSGNDIVIGCYLSQQTWQLKCDGHEWKGQVGTCPETYTGIEDQNVVSEAVETKDESKMLLAMIVIVGAAVIICIAVVTTGIMCLQRCKRTYKKMQPTSHVVQYPTAVSNCNSS